MILQGGADEILFLFQPFHSAYQEKSLTDLTKVISKVFDIP